MEKARTEDESGPAIVSFSSSVGAAASAASAVVVARHRFGTVVASAIVAGRGVTAKYCFCTIATSRCLSTAVAEYCLGKLFIFAWRSLEIPYRGN